MCIYVLGFLKAKEISFAKTATEHFMPIAKPLTGKQCSLFHSSTEGEKSHGSWKFHIWYISSS